jgi:PAS domain S-box-containing protein
VTIEAAVLPVSPAEEHVRLFADALPAIIFMADAAGRCTFTNQRYHSYSGQPPEALLGTGWVKTLHPDDQHAIHAQWNAAVARAEPFEADFRFGRHDGAYRWHAVRGAPVKNAAGETAAWIGVCFDVEEDRETTAVLDAVLEAAPIGIGFWDRRLRFRKLNARLAEINGISAEASLGKRPDELFPDLEGLDQVLQTWRGILETGRPVLDMEIRGKTHAPAGEERVWLEDFFPVRLGGEIIGVGAVVEDITERRQAELERRERDARKDQFLATLGHELRGPLAPLRAAIDMLRLSEHDAAARARMLGMMDRQLDHLVRLVDDLLDLSRITQGKIQLRMETCDVRELITQAMQAAHANEHGSRQVSLELPDDTLVVRADPVRICQALANLLTNACKYTSDDGRIWVKVTGGPGTVRISVRDDGIGIDETMLEEIFDLFRQGYDARGGGLGIGLTLVRTLLTLHGGSVEARSEGRGRGAEFIVTLPLAAPQAAFAFRNTTLLEKIAGRRVLLVDDQEDVTESLAALLGALGATVQVANDGATALELFGKFQPEAALLDISMPGMNGYQLSRAIRERYPASHPLLVAVTGWGQDSDKARAMAAGFDMHLTKPLGMPGLQRVIEHLELRAAQADRVTG